MKVQNLKNRCSKLLPLFYTHLLPLLVVMALLKFLILTRFLAEFPGILWNPVAPPESILTGTLLQILPLTLLSLLFFLLTGMGRLRRTLLSLQSLLMVVDIAGLYFFSVYREWFRVEDFHLLEGATAGNTGKLISGQIPLLLFFLHIVFGILCFLWLHNRLAGWFSRRRRTGRTMVHVMLAAALVAGFLNLTIQPLFGKSARLGDVPVAALAGSALNDLLGSTHYSAAGGPAAYNYRHIRNMLYRAADFRHPDPRTPFLRTTCQPDTLQTGVLAAPGRRNIILFVLESASAHVMGSTFRGRVIAPSLAALQRRALSFRRYHTSGFPSARGHEAMFYSLYPPFMNGYTHSQHHDIAFVERLRAAGYRTGCFASTYYQPLRADAFFRKSGHELYRYPLSYGIKPDDPVAAEVRMLTRMHRHILALGNKRPFFMTFLSEIGHIPYRYYPARADIPKLFPDDDSEEARYANQMHFIGETVARFIRSAERHPAYRNTVFIITADHEPNRSLNVAAFIHGKTVARDIWHKHSLIPLMLYAPGIVRKDPAVEARPAAQVDLGPTVLQLTGIDPGTHRGFGQSLLRRNFNHDRYIMLQGKDAIYDNRVIREEERTVRILPLPAGSPWSEKITTWQLFHNYRILRRCLKDSQDYYQQVERKLPLVQQPVHARLPDMHRGSTL